MNKRLILILALALVVGVTFAAYAEVQNVKVSGDLTITGVSRKDLTLTKDEENFTAGGSIDFGKKVAGWISQARVRVDANLTDNVSATVRLLNERIWGEEIDTITSTNTSSTRDNNADVAIDLAYATMKEFLYSPLTLTIGRQELRFGNALIIGDPDTNAIAAGHDARVAAGVSTTRTRSLPNSLDDLSMRKSFDAIRATLDYNPLVVDLMYSKISESSITAYDDVNLYGANASYAVNSDLSIEGYAFQRARGRSFVEAATLPAKHEKLNVVGLRGNYTGVKDLTLGIEGAYQFGDHLANAAIYPNERATTNETRKVKAYALQALASYNLPVVVEYAPNVSATYTYVSGEKPFSNRKTYKGWDPMFEDQNKGTLFNKIFALTNMQIINLNASVKPMADVKVTLSYYNLMSPQPNATENGTAGSGATGNTTPNLSGIANDPTYTMKPEKHALGNEWDLGITYDYTADVQFMLYGGRFIPGGAFEKPNRKTASQLVGSMKVTF